MKWVELVVAGFVGGAVGALGISLLFLDGNLLEMLAVGLKFYTNTVALMIASIVLGWITGHYSQSSQGAFLAGLATPFIYIALLLAF